MVIYLKDFFLCTFLYTAKKSFFVSDSFSKFLAAIRAFSRVPFICTRRKNPSSYLTHSLNF